MSLLTVPLMTDRSNLPSVFGGSCARMLPFFVDRLIESAALIVSAERRTLPFVLTSDSGPDTCVATTSPFAVCAVTPAATPSIDTEPFDVFASTTTFAGTSASRPALMSVERWKRLNIARMPFVFLPRYPFAPHVPLFLHIAHTK